MRRFLFDTADAEYIERAWEKLYHYFTKDSVVGITTNPNAMNKIGVTTLKGYKETIMRLVDLMTRIRGNDGEVHVQIPNSRLSPSEVGQWVNDINDLKDDSTRIIIKIPPYATILNNIEEITGGVYDLNVTGVSDCATALHCMMYYPKYISLIYGRMEEVGINAYDHTRYAMTGLIASRNDFTEVIAGSMRDLNQLKVTIQEGTIPTIGTRVFDMLLADEDKLRDFACMWPHEDDEHPTVFTDFSPPVTDVNLKLSFDFFAQMDILGQNVTSEFLAEYTK